MNTDLMFSSKSDNWATPLDFFQKVESEFGPFDLDPASDHENHKAPKYFTREDDGLSKDWHGKVWLNPPYGRGLKDWVKKCFLERERESSIDMPPHSCENGHELLPRLHIQQARRRNSLHSMTAQILRRHELSTFPINARNF